MTGRWLRIKELFAELADATVTERRRVLAQARGEDAQLGEELERLLAADGCAAESFLSPLVPEDSNPPAAPLFSPGDLVANRYRIEKRLGAGGMGEVYRALDLEVREAVALKALLARSSGELAAERLRRELRTARSVNHPNICRVFDIGRHSGNEGECLFFTMELLEGELLKERLERRGRYSVEEALPVALQIANALAAAHGAGVVHRDLKPGNVMLARSADGAERAVILDFGLADFADPLARVKLTQTGHAFGTPGYMAPEQLRGQATPASDVYAFGVLMGEMARVPERRRRFTLASAWRGIAARCSNPDPERRYPAASHVVKALRSAAARKSRLRIAAVAVLLVLAAGVGLLRLDRRDPGVDPASVTAGNELRNGLYWNATRSLAGAIRADPRAVLPRAQLAYAWMELDEWDRAQQAILELQLASRKRPVSSWDQLYVNGVQHLAARQFPVAAQKFEQRARTAPPEAAPSAWVEAGRVFFRAEKLDRAEECYREAIRLNSALPLAWQYLASLLIRKQDYDKAQQALATAEQQFRAEGLPAAVAEVMYRRGMMYANQRKSAEAEAEVRRAIAVAEASGDPRQLAWCKLQLSIALWQADAPDKSLQEGREALRIAQAAGLESLVARSSLDLGSAQLLKRSYDAAEESFRAAYYAAKRLKTRELEGRALFSLGSLYIRTGKLNEGADRLGEALPLLEANGLRREAAGARILLGRAMRDRGEYDRAAAIFSEQLGIAQRAGSTQDILLARESLASVLIRQERYPEALALHAENYRQLAVGAPGLTRFYAALNYGAALWLSGEYVRARELLAESEKAGGSAAGADLLLERARMELSLANYSSAITFARSAADVSPAGTKDLARAQTVQCAALVSLGPTSRSLPECEQAVQNATAANDLAVAAESRRWLAAALIENGRAAQARSMLESLREQHRRAGQRDSLWRTLGLLAIADLRLGDKSTARANAASSLATVNELIATLPEFGRRPDVRFWRKRISALQ